jgi:hypothetical protein
MKHFKDLLLKLIIYVYLNGGKVLIVIFSNVLLRIQKEILMFILFAL